MKFRETIASLEGQSDPGARFGAFKTSLKLPSRRRAVLCLRIAAQRQDIRPSAHSQMPAHGTADETVVAGLFRRSDLSPQGPGARCCQERPGDDQLA